jgi:hypothetical protein
VLAWDSCWGQACTSIRFALSGYPLTATATDNQLPAYWSSYYELTGGSHFHMTNIKYQVFADESKKRGFLLAAAIIDQGEVSRVRTIVNGLRLPGQRRLHFAKESNSRRKIIIRAFIEASVRVAIYDATSFSNDKLGRDAAIAKLADDAAAMGAVRLVLERDDSVVASDKLIINDRLINAGHRDLRYEHQRAHEESLLAIPDAVAWCWAKGGHWQETAGHLVTEVIPV